MSDEPTALELLARRDPSRVSMSVGEAAAVYSALASVTMCGLDDRLCADAEALLAGSGELLRLRLYRVLLRLLDAMADEAGVDARGRIGAAHARLDQVESGIREEGL